MKTNKRSKKQMKNKEKYASKEKAKDINKKKKKMDSNNCGNAIAELSFSLLSLLSHHSLFIPHAFIADVLGHSPFYAQ